MCVPRLLSACSLVSHRVPHTHIGMGLYVWPGVCLCIPEHVPMSVCFPCACLQACEPVCCVPE